MFDKYFIDSAQALRDKLAVLDHSSPGENFSKTSNAWISLAAEKAAGGAAFGLLPSSACGALAKHFPTPLSRACVLHADSFRALMDTAEFDEWQQQLLLVQQQLREIKDLVPPLSNPAKMHKCSASQNAPGKVRALPVLSLGGGIFRGSGSKLISLSVQVSFLPSWTEEDLLPPALDQAVCSEGEGAGAQEIAWVKEQWSQVTQAYRELKQRLHMAVVEALKQRNLLTEVFCTNSRTQTTHAGGRLPWRRETYKLVSSITCVSKASTRFACSQPAEAHM